MKKLIKIDQKNYPIFEEMSYDSDDVKIHEINNGVVTRLGVVYYKNGLSISSLYQYPFAFIKLSIISFLSILKRRLITINSEIAIIHSAWTKGYFHWLTESLPRLVKLNEEHSDIDIYIPENYKQYEIYFNILGIKKPKYFPTNANIKSRKVILASCARQMVVYSPDIYRDLRLLFSNKLELCSSPWRKIYITRANSRGRKVINEQDVYDLMRKLGYEVYDFDCTPVLEQIRICSESSSIVSIHGAALTNMLFMPEGGHVLEFIPKKRNLFREFNFVRGTHKHDPCFARLAFCLKHSYNFLECKSISGGQRMSHMDNMIVDLRELEKILSVENYDYSQTIN